VHELRIATANVKVLNVFLRSIFYSFFERLDHGVEMLLVIFEVLAATANDLLLPAGNPPALSDRCGCKGRLWPIRRSFGTGFTLKRNTGCPV
jgi:hypothetical protein